MKACGAMLLGGGLPLSALSQSTKAVAAGTRVVLLGQSVPLTGAAGEIGLAFAAGSRLAVGEFNERNASSGIQLKLQSRRAEGPAAGAVEEHRFLMTRNQALILAKYPLDSTGQSLPGRVRQGPLRRLIRRLTGG